MVSLTDGASLDANAQPMWTPAHPERTQATLFREHVAKTRGLKLDTYEDLQKWSCENRGDFWSDVWDWEGVVGDKGAAPVSHAREPGSLDEWRQGWMSVHMAMAGVCRVLWEGCSCAAEPCTTCCRHVDARFTAGDKTSWTVPHNIFCPSPENR